MSDPNRPGPTLVAANIRHLYGDTVALAGVSLELRPGVTGLLGPNGAGKTSLIRILATAMAPTSGTLDILGTRPSTAAAKCRIRRRLGYMPQNPGFFPGFRTAEFVDHIAVLNEITDRGSRRAETRRVLDLVGLAEVAGRRIKHLSGGMLQRLALACALVGEPDILILDEPMVGLDPEQRLRLREVVARIGEDRTVLLSTHQTEDVMTLCSRVVVLDHGDFRFDGAPNALAGEATGMVWRSAERPATAVASWRTSDGSYRSVGIAPPSATPLEPTLEDGYLVLITESLTAARRRARDVTS